MRKLSDRQFSYGLRACRIAGLWIASAALVSWSSCTQPEEIPPDGGGEASCCGVDDPIRGIWLEMDMCPLDPMPTLYADWVDTDSSGRLVRAFEEVCNEFAYIQQDPMDSGIRADIQAEYQLARVHESCYDPASANNLHLILVKSYSPEPDWDGVSNPGPAYLGGYSILFCEHINTKAGDTNYREKLGTLVATHELGHQRGIPDEACMNCQGYPADCDVNPNHWSNGQPDPDCVMAALKTVYFQNLGIRAVYSRCSDTNRDLVYNISFCDSCCHLLRDVWW